jgi:hypothetical protein
MSWLLPQSLKRRTLAVFYYVNFMWHKGVTRFQFLNIKRLSGAADGAISMTRQTFQQIKLALSVAA